MKQPEKKGRKKKGILPFPLVLAAVILLSFAGITSARYVIRQESSTVADAEEFYFTSDLLKEKEDNAVYFIDPKATDFTINLYNYEDSQRKTNAVIKYTISVDGGTSEDSAGGELKTECNSVKITPLADGKGEKTVKVTATSVKPYAKTLTAEFKMILGNQFKIEDESGNRAAVLTMICADSGKDIVITLPVGVIPDATDGRVMYDNSTNKCTFSSGGSGIYSLILLKTDTAKVLSGEETGMFADSIVIK